MCSILKKKFVFAKITVADVFPQGSVCLKSMKGDFVLFRFKATGVLSLWLKTSSEKQHTGWLEDHTHMHKHTTQSFVLGESVCVCARVRA